MKSQNLYRLLLVVMVGTAPALPAENVSLSSLDLTKMTTGWSDAKADLEITGKPLSIGGRKFERWRWDARYQQLSREHWRQRQTVHGLVGVDDSAGGQGSVEFIVSGDGKVSLARAAR